MSETFEYLIVVEALGLLYGSAGRFLSPENLVGRSGTSFPPSAATLSGLYAASLSKEELSTLRLAGPFWAKSENPQNFYVPTPFYCLVEMEKYTEPGEIKQGTIKHQLKWHTSAQQWHTETGDSPTGKFSKGSWINIQTWHQPQQVFADPWEYLPHLHPRLESNQRKVDTTNQQGSLFLENAVQLHPDTCLIYLSNTALPKPDGWYRFGGEGHMVNVQSIPIDAKTKDLLNQPVGQSFALITAAIWGSNRFSYREPMIFVDNKWKQVWQIETLLTERPAPFRYRLGGKGTTKRLSRGRYAVPAGSVYILKESLQEPWHDWPKTWFPTEAYSFKRWGCGLALPLPQVMPQVTGVKAA